MDREAIARDRRRRQAVEQLDFEREREAALRDQLEEVIAEQLGASIDAAAFAQMAQEEVAVLREALSGADDDAEPFEDEWLEVEEDDEDPAEAAEAEITRLQAELEESGRRQGALAAYLAALDVPTPVSE